VNILADILFCLGEGALFLGAGLACFRVGRAEGHQQGYKTGLQAGRDEQWLDDYLAQGRRRCGRCGRFSTHSNN
jgi:hypothetical protein